MNKKHAYEHFEPASPSLIENTLCQKGFKYDSSKNKCIQTLSIAGVPRKTTNLIQNKCQNGYTLQNNKCVYQCEAPNQYFYNNTCYTCPQEYVFNVKDKNCIKQNVESVKKFCPSGYKFANVNNTLKCAYSTYLNPNYKIINNKKSCNSPNSSYSPELRICSSCPPNTTPIKNSKLSSVYKSCLKNNFVDFS